MSGRLWRANRIVADDVGLLLLERVERRRLACRNSALNALLGCRLRVFLFRPRALGFRSHPSVRAEPRERDCSSDQITGSGVSAWRWYADAQRLEMTAEEEQQIIVDLASPPEDLYPFPTPESAKVQARFIIRQVCGCSEDEAHEHLKVLMKLIHLTASPGGASVHGKLPKARWGWAREPSEG